MNGILCINICLIFRDQAAPPPLSALPPPPLDDQPTAGLDEPPNYNDVT